MRSAVGGNVALRAAHEGAKAARAMWACRPVQLRSNSLQHLHFLNCSRSHLHQHQLVGRRALVGGRLRVSNAVQELQGASDALTGAEAGPPDWGRGLATSAGPFL
jgi:hypothetical protein